MSWFDDLGIGLATVTFGKESDFRGNQASIGINVTPKAVGLNGTLDLRWIASGDMLSSYVMSQLADAGEQGSIRLPFTDQPGFARGSSAFSGWYYYAEVTRTLAGQTLDVRRYRFQIATGQSILDLDALDEDGQVTALPAIAPLATVTSVNGLTGAITVPFGQAALTRIATKTGAYAANPNELVPTDATAGAFAVALPTAPADQTRQLVKKLDATSNIVTLQAGGADVFNKVGGSTAITLTVQNQAATLQYDAATKVWTVLSDDLPLSQLDLRYATPANISAAQTAAAADATYKASAAQTAAIAAAAADASTKAAAAQSAAASDASTKAAAAQTAAASDASSKITALGLKSASTHAATDFDAAGTATTAAAAVLLHGTPNAITGTATAVGGVRNTVDGTAGAYTVTLPAPAFVGQPLVVERIDTTTANAVTLQGAVGATIEGSTSRVITLAAVGVANESILFVAESSTSWSVAAGHKPGSWIDAYIAQRIATPGSATGTSLAAAYVTYDGTSLRQAGAVVPISGGGGVTFGTDGSGFDTITLSDGSSASFSTDPSGFDSLVLA